MYGPDEIHLIFMVLNESEGLAEREDPLYVQALGDGVYFDPNSGEWFATCPVCDEIYRAYLGRFHVCQDEFMFGTCA